MTPRAAAWIALACAGCAAPQDPVAELAAAAPAPVRSPSPLPSTPPAPSSSPPPPAPPPSSAPVDAIPWLRGDTHVHARPSGDSSEPIADVIAWYEQRGYDFIVLTDHNKVSEVDPAAASTAGQPFVRFPDNGLVILAGTELTFNPSSCVPRGDRSRKCRIHVNAIGVTERPAGKIAWANRKTHDRVAMYQAAFDEAARLGAALAQINHPQWYWGMTADVLHALATRGARLVEIANIQFPKWNAGDADHASTEALWDAVLARGDTLWGVASDDAHAYHGHGDWPAGGGWIVVHARREPRAILAALAAGDFYASTGVTLARDERDGDELVVETRDAGAQVTWIVDGHAEPPVAGPSARHAIPATGYVRADVRRPDGAMAWVQPARRATIAP